VVARTRQMDHMSTPCFFKNNTKTRVFFYGHDVSPGRRQQEARDRVQASLLPFPAFSLSLAL
jgi:hypothetical protein